MNNWMIRHLVFTLLLLSSPAYSQTLITTQYQYDTYGNLIKAIDPFNRTVETQYDTLLNTYPVKVINPLGQTQESTYDIKTGNILTSTDPNSIITQNQYDLLGRLIKTIGPNDSEEFPSTFYIYDDSSFPNKVTVQKRIQSGQPEVLTVVTELDGLGRKIRTLSQDEQGNLSIISDKVTYDSEGRIKEKFLPFKQGEEELKATFTYDSQGRTTRIDNPDSTFKTFEYNLLSAAETNEKGQRKTVQKDIMGRTTQVTEVINNVPYTSVYTYDLKDNLIALTDSQGNVTQMEYDTLGRKISMQDPNMGSWTYQYDSLGNLTEQHDNKGQRIVFNYDPLNRLNLKSLHPSPSANSVQPQPMARRLTTAISLGEDDGGGGPPSPQPVTIRYNYDNPAKPYGKGRISDIEDLSGMADFKFDNLGREIESRKVMKGSSTLTVTRLYDSLDRLMSINYSNNMFIQYTYNLQNQIETISTHQGLFITNIDYNSKNQITREEYSSGVTREYTYDSQTQRLNRLKVTGAESNTLQDISYTFDEIGNITRIDDLANQNIQIFDYDDLNRLIEAQGTLYGARTYSYDELGNLTHKNGITFTYGSSNLPHAVMSTSEGLSMKYDANGNMTKKGNIRYTYDSENRLIKAEQDQGAYASPLTLNIPLTTGENYISVPLSSSETLSQILTNSQVTLGNEIISIQRFNPETQSYESLRPDDLLEVGRGYKVIANQAVTLTLTGTVPQGNTTLSLKIGQNLIGTPSLISHTQEYLLGNITYTSLKRFNETTHEWEEYHNDLNPNEAYLVTLPLSQTWNINTSIQTTTFAYDGDGGRTKKVTPEGTTYYIGQSWTVEGNEQTVDIYLGDRRVGFLNNQNESYIVHTDHLGSSSLITDNQGEVIEQIDYEPYGEIARQTGEDLTDKLFTGHILDPSTGLIFMQARYYDPSLGRFITPDTIVPDPSDPQAFNRYSYARNNPIVYTDPNGHTWLSKLIGGILGVVAGIFGGPELGFFVYNLVDSAITSIETGDWRPIVGFYASAGLNALLPTFTSGNLFGDVAQQSFKGAVIGTATSAINGDDIGEGALTGAGVGAAIGFASSQQFTNAVEGNGFRSNQEVINKLVSDGRFQEAIDYTSSKYGFPSGVYDPNLSPTTYGETDMFLGTVRFGPLAFKNPSDLQATGFHEGRHVWQAKTNQPKWRFPVGPRNDMLFNRFDLEIDASVQTLRHAGRLNLNRTSVYDEKRYLNDNRANKLYRELWDAA